MSNDKRRRRQRLKNKTSLRQRVIEDYGTRCWICKQNCSIKKEKCSDPHYLTLDHVIPVALGGRDELDNLRPAHRICNEKRGREIEKVFKEYFTENPIEQRHA